MRNNYREIPVPIVFALISLQGGGIHQRFRSASATVSGGVRLQAQAAVLVCHFPCLSWSRTQFLVCVSVCVFLTDLPGSDLSLPPHLRNLLHFILKCRAHYCLSSVMPGPGLHPSCCHWRHLTEIIFNGDEIFIVFPHFKSHGALVGTRRLNWHALASDAQQKDESCVMIQ